FFPEWWIGHAVGWPLVVAGVLLSEWSKRTMLRAGVDPHPHEPTTAIVATGPYAVSRNPMYVFATVVYVGIAFVVNAFWPIVFLPFGIALLYYGVIAREESYMERVFGDEYRQYKARVRRWV
ncbi:MAG: isoprenylcysteine carboxylmethyltransferase family protein, partial [Actinobacteria bacterium]|nr:isoprenylcysteine carboxylmethyltransferase family protein [Actinomycetota bacterium]